MKFNSNIHDLIFGQTRPLSPFIQSNIYLVVAFQSKSNLSDFKSYEIDEKSGLMMA
jgi:hypothetical protein